MNMLDGIINTQMKHDTKRAVSNVSTETINVILRKGKTKSELLQFLHATCFSLVGSNMIQIISNNHFTTWPGLTNKLIARHLPPSILFAIGHQNQERCLQSTKPTRKYGDCINTIKQNI